MIEDEVKEKERLKAIVEEEDRKIHAAIESKQLDERTEAEYRSQKLAINEKRIQKFLKDERQKLEDNAQPIR